MKLKAGVKARMVSPQILLALLVAWDLWDEHGQELVVTSINEGRHGMRSKHWRGDAVDLRSHDLRSPAKAASELQDRLGADFDVVYEGDHIHVEYDPKGAINETTTDIA